MLPWSPPPDCDCLPPPPFRSPAVHHAPPMVHSAWFEIPARESPRGGVWTGHPQPGGLGRRFDLHRDGERVALRLSGDESGDAADRVVVVTNFFDELRRLTAEGLPHPREARRRGHGCRLQGRGHPPRPILSGLVSAPAAAPPPTDGLPVSSASGPSPQRAGRGLLRGTVRAVATR